MLHQVDRKGGQKRLILARIGHFTAAPNLGHQMKVIHIRQHRPGRWAWFGVPLVTLHQRSHGDSFRPDTAEEDH
jgi:hypothetical protein